MDLPQFYEEHINKVYKFFYIKSLNRAVAEDLTSQTFIEFVEKCKTTDIESPTKYLYGIMRFVWIAYLREKYQHQITYVEDIEDFEDYSTRTVSDYESRSAHQRALDLIEDLPAKQHEVLNIRIIQNKSVKETALIMGKTSNYVKTMQHRALVTLRSRIQEPLQIERGVS